MARTRRTYEAHEKVIQAKKRLAQAKTNGKKKTDSNPHLALILKSSPHYEQCQPLPYEIMMKIFHEIIQQSEHPIKELCNLASVCEAWRMVILQTPSLWSRINFNQLPLTDGNFKVLSQLLDNLPTITNYVKEMSLRGPIHVKSSESLDFLEKIVRAPKLDELSIDRLDPQCKAGTMSHVLRAISKSRQLKRLSIKSTRHFFTNQRWISEYLAENGQQLEELHLTSSLRTISPQLFRALAYDFCPSLRVLDLSTCDFLCNHTFDAVLLAQTMPNLVVLRLANVSFKRVHFAPQQLGLIQLEELSMPISVRDADRDDALFATLAFGSDRVSSLDLRGSCISAHALIDMPSYNVKALHIDDTCPLTRNLYGSFIAKWQHSLRIVSLVKINCSRTIRQCLEGLVNDDGETRIREIDLESSDVTEEDLKWFLARTSSLQMINLSSCRSLPRGCKGRYSTASCSDNSQPLAGLIRRLGVLETHSESETEIDEENSWDSLNGSLPRKRKRVAKKQPDYILDF